MVDMRFELTTNDSWSVDEALCNLTFAICQCSACVNRKKRNKKRIKNEDALRLLCADPRMKCAHCSVFFHYVRLFLLLCVYI